MSALVRRHVALSTCSIALRAHTPANCGPHGLDSRYLHTTQLQYQVPSSLIYQKSVYMQSARYKLSHA
jgi:hypothetical protein